MTRRSDPVAHGDPYTQNSMDPLPPEMERAASRYVCGEAQSKAEALELLGALGLISLAQYRRAVRGQVDVPVTDPDLCSKQQHRMTPENTCWRSRGGEKRYRECRAYRRRADRARRGGRSAAA